MLPSWNRSRNCSPRLVYFFAIETTRRRLASTSSFFACSACASPRWMTSIVRRRRSGVSSRSSIIPLTCALMSFCLLRRFFFSSSFSFGAQLIADDEDALGNGRCAGDRLDDRELAALDALGDGHLALAREQRYRAHLAEVHPDRVVRLVERAGRQVELGTFLGTVSIEV